MTEDRYEPYPLDFEILQRLPDVGSMLGYHTLGTTVKALKRELADGGATSGQIAGRLKSMQDVGMVVPVTVLPVGDGKGWQITAKGKALLARNGMGLAVVPTEVAQEVAPESRKSFPDTVERVIAAVQNKEVE